MVNIHVDVPARPYDYRGMSQFGAQARQLDRMVRFVRAERGIAKRPRIFAADSSGNVPATLISVFVVIIDNYRVAGDYAAGKIGKFLGEFSPLLDAHDAP